MLILPEDSSETQRALFLCRSITILGEYYLVGSDPVDEEGKKIPAGEVHREALGAYLSGDESHWRRFTVPDIHTLLSLA